MARVIEEILTRMLQMEETARSSSTYRTQAIVKVNATSASLSQPELQDGDPDSARVQIY
jgi:hypothetical protein